MRTVRLLITTIMVVVLVAVGGAYSIADGQSTVAAKSKYCKIKKCTKNYEHKHKVCPKKKCTKTYLNIIPIC